MILVFIICFSINLGSARHKNMANLLCIATSCSGGSPTSFLCGGGISRMKALKMLVDPTFLGQIHSSAISPSSVLPFQVV